MAKVWRNALLLRTLRASATERVSLTAAGSAFYGTLALFPGLCARISVGGLVLDLVTAERQLVALSGLLPAPAFSLISELVHQIVQQSGSSLRVHLAVTFLLTFSSNSTGVKSLLAAVSVVYDVTEQQPSLRFHLIGL